MGRLSFRRWVEKLRADGKLTEAKKPLSSRLEAAAFIKALELKPTLLHVDGREIPVAANICAPLSLIAEYLNIQLNQIAPKLLAAIEHPTKPQRINNPPCFEKAKFPEVDWGKLS